MAYKISPLSDALGIEVLGANLHPNMTQEEVNKFQELILKHQVVVFRNQNLAPMEQIQTCRLFGLIEPHPLKENTCPYPEMTIVSNVSEDGKPLGYPGPMFHLWHSDMCYEQHPPKFSFLYAEKVPGKGGNTLFANTRQAYEDLEYSFQQYLLSLNAVFGFSEKLMARCQERGYSLVIAPCDQRRDVIHPVIRFHPITQKPAIFVNWTHTDRIIGLTDDDSQHLLKKLYDHYTQSHYVYSHHYQANDLIVWDNSSTMHTGDGTIAIDKPRVMRRVVVNF